jgi:hypothetical protein
MSTVSLTSWHYEMGNWWPELIVNTRQHCKGSSPFTPAMTGIATLILVQNCPALPQPPATHLALTELRWAVPVATAKLILNTNCAGLCLASVWVDTAKVEGVPKDLSSSDCR